VSVTNNICLKTEARLEMGQVNIQLTFLSM